MLRDKLSGKVLDILMRFISLITLVFSGVVTYYGLLLVLKNFIQVTTGLHLPMGLVYLCLPVGGLVMMFYSFLQLTGLQRKIEIEKTEEENV